MHTGRTVRNRDSKSQNHIKQVRKLDRRAKHNLHRFYLQQRLDFLRTVLDKFRAGHPLPEGWLGLYPELSSVLHQVENTDGNGLLWLLNDELGRWFLLLRGYSQADKGISAGMPGPGECDDRFTMDLVCMAQCSRPCPPK